MAGAEKHRRRVASSDGGRFVVDHRLGVSAIRTQVVAINATHGIFDVQQVLHLEGDLCRRPDEEQVIRHLGRFDGSWADAVST